MLCRYVLIAGALALLSSSLQAGSNKIIQERYDMKNKLKAEYEVDAAGNKNGYYKEWYFNGQMKEHLYYKDNERDYNNKTYKTWDSNGTLTSKVIYKNRESRIDSVWSNTGMLRHAITTRDGEIISEWYFDQ